MTAPLSVTTAPDQLLCRIAGIGDLFAIEGEFVTGKEIPSGHINTTYKATYRKSDGTEDSYILQRINDYVFKDPKAVMRNVEKVTRHINWKVLRRLKDSAGQTLNLYPARGGRNYIDTPRRRHLALLQLPSRHAHLRRGGKHPPGLPGGICLWLLPGFDQ